MKTIQFDTIPDLFPAGDWQAMQIRSPIVLAQYWGTEVQLETVKHDEYELSTNDEGHLCTLWIEHADIDINGATVLSFKRTTNTQH